MDEPKTRQEKIKKLAFFYSHTEFSEDNPPENFKAIEDAYIEGASWADRNPIPFMKRIIDEQPKHGQLFVGLRKAVNKGYQFAYCYRDIEDGSYHDLLEEMEMRNFKLQSMLLSENIRPKWMNDFNPNEIRIYPPDWWMPLPDIKGCEVYEGSPTDKILKKEYENYQSYKLLKKIEDEMNNFLNK